MTGSKDTAQLWAALRARTRQDISALFAAQAARFDSFSARLDDLLLDFSKTAICRDSLAQLLQLAQASGVEEARAALFAGEKINISEGRAALHTALRAPAGSRLMVGGEDIMPLLQRERGALLEFADGCRSGSIAAADGQPYTDIVNIGIGGSDTGARMAAAALAPYGGRLRLHFVSNMDGAHLADTLAALQPARTLVIVSSKTFTTAETLANAAAAKHWLGDAAAAQMVAVTAAAARAQAAGMEKIFPMQEAVGGRYSLWGGAGLPLALAVGSEHFEELLSGAAAMDAHFCSAPPPQNLPLLLALTGVWHRNVCGYPTRAVFPYDQRLHLLPAYLQQLEMESNGKHVMQSGEEAAQATAPVVWGGAGTDAQHATFQLLHQGSDIAPAEFIVAAQPLAADEGQHRQLVANCLAQSAALMQGQRPPDAPHRHCAGNRPSITILQRQLTPYALGRLLALYEHRTFVESVLWGINPFDQWGVELGKAAARRLQPLLQPSADCSGEDASTRGLLAHYRALSEAAD